MSELLKTEAALKAIKAGKKVIASSTEQIPRLYKVDNDSMVSLERLDEDDQFEATTMSEQQFKILYKRTQWMPAPEAAVKAIDTARAAHEAKLKGGTAAGGTPAQ